MAKPIGTLGTIDTLTIGGRVFTDLSNLIILGGYGGITPNLYSTFRANNGSAGYTPSGSKTFVYSAIQVFNNSNTTTDAVYGYGDNDVGIIVSTVPTNPKYPGNNLELAIFFVEGNVAPNVGTAVEISNFIVPNGKFPFITNDGGASSFTARAYGYEV